MSFPPRFACLSPPPFLPKRKKARKGNVHGPHWLRGPGGGSAASAAAAAASFAAVSAAAVFSFAVSAAAVFSFAAVSAAAAAPSRPGVVLQGVQMRVRPRVLGHRPDVVEAVAPHDLRGVGPAAARD